MAVEAQRLRQLFYLSQRRRDAENFRVCPDLIYISIAMYENICDRLISLQLIFVFSQLNCLLIDY